ncbi:MAG: hypothetical protein AB7N91_28165 [Candidatus Tectimicrobiota bacterium]
MDQPYASQGRAPGASPPGPLPAALITVVILLDQLLWRPLLAWSERFKMAMAAGASPSTSWFYNVLRQFRLIAGVRQLLHRVSAPLDRLPRRRFWVCYLSGVLGAALLLYGLWRAWGMLSLLSAGQWLRYIAYGVGATFLRVSLALVLIMAWTIPVGVAVGTRPRLAAWLQPAAEIAASIPATARFPVLVSLLLRLPAGMQYATLVP